jgi:hypothetical protein
MSAIRVETTVDEVTAHAIPALRPLLGKRVELIAQETDGVPLAAPRRRHTFDELLQARLTPPPGVNPVSLEDMEKAFQKGALGAGR